LLTGKKRLPGFSGEWEEKRLGDICGITAVRLKVEENQLVDIFSEIGIHIDGLKGR
jgi:hypothetical protein